MRRECFHAGGETDYEAAVGPLRERTVFRLRGRFYQLVGRLCRRGGLMRGWRIRLAWGRITERHLRRVRTKGDKSRALWLHA